jgi:hypothetical protein
MPLITVHRLVEDARRITVEDSGVVRDLGRVYSDPDLVEALRRAGLESPEEVLDNVDLLRWEGAGPHVWGSQQPRPPTRP